MTFVAYFWLALMVFFLMTEVATVGLVSIWFAAGALIAALVCLMGSSIGVQCFVFLLASGAMLALLRPFSRKYLAPKITSTNVDSVVGTVGIVTEAVDNLHSTGQVKLGAMTWTARSASGAPIALGATVRVDRIEGVKVIVSPAEETAAV